MAQHEYEEKYRNRWAGGRFSGLRCHPAHLPHADPSIPDTPEDWLDSFNTFSIYQVLPQIIELWGLNTKTEVQAKKNFAQLTGK